ncbi:stage II sporulation protein P [Ornithinibacillus californiensis]|uniref:stage II sporulation protein P n=1 Tax=Ornithinibacillus californiensis TaxID=161536 RepID=UPI00069E9C79|nr:stage II sporulation protein P [Ornithinibacillus californiensis]
MKNANNRVRIFSIILISLFVPMTIIITMVINNSNMKNNMLAQLINSDEFSKVFLSIMGEEIPNFKEYIDNEYNTPSIGNLLLESITGINTDNLNMLLISEIPGFSHNNVIYVAGQGSDYSNLPQESPPPDFDELLKTEGPDNDNHHVPNLTTDKPNNPTVFIYQSHSWEGYLPLMAEHGRTSDSSSINNNENVVLVGSMLTKKLKEYGVYAVQDETNIAKALKDRGWNYSHSYQLSRELIETTVSKNEDITYLIDIHRDSATRDITTITINGKSYARLYFVVGKEYANYEENLLFAKELHEKLEEKYPGLSRGVYLKTSSEGNGVYNQDISNRSLLIEMGGIENNKKELSNTIDAFSDVFMEKYEGVIEVIAPNQG